VIIDGALDQEGLEEGQAERMTARVAEAAVGGKGGARKQHPIRPAAGLRAERTRMRGADMA
jgi:hypothetical protein